MSAREHDEKEVRTCMEESDLEIYTFDNLHQLSAYRYRSHLLATTPMYIRAQKIAISATRSPEMNPWK